MLILETLSWREHEVYELLQQAYSTRGIADHLVISEATARNHIQAIMRKLDAHSRLEAVAKSGVVDAQFLLRLLQRSAGLSERQREAIEGVVAEVFSCDHECDVHRPVRVAKIVPLKSSNNKE